MTELIKKNMVSKPFTDSDGQDDATFMDIQELDDVWIWMDKVFIAYLAPSEASYESVCIIKSFLELVGIHRTTANTTILQYFV